MKQFTFTIKDSNGMHARPAGMLANCAKKYGARVQVKTADKEVDGKRLLSLMSLGATCGTSVTFVVDGVDEAEACRALEALCRDTLGGGHE